MQTVEVLLRALSNFPNGYKYEIFEDYIFLGGGNQNIAIKRKKKKALFSSIAKGLNSGSSTRSE